MEAVVEASSSPWWGIPVIAGLFLLIGAVVSYLSVKASDSRRAKVEAKIRWHEEVRKFSAQAVSAARIVEAEAKFQRRFESSPRAEISDKDADRLNASTTRANEAHKELERLEGDLALVAPNNVIVAMIQMETASHSVTNSWGEDLEPQRKRLEKVTLDFVVEVREYLGTDQDDIRKS
jgi:hypothetical protein